MIKHHMSTLHNVFIFTALHHYKKSFFSLIHKYSNKQGNCIEVSVQNSSCCKCFKYKLYLVSGSIMLSEIQTEITIREFKVEASYSIKMLEIDSK